jgi:hypothetical protein
MEHNPYPQRGHVSAAREAAASVKPTAEDLALHDGAQIGARLHQRRLRAIAALSPRPAPADPGRPR